MCKRVGLALLALVSGMWFILTLLGDKIEPRVSLFRAWMVPFGNRGWQVAIRPLIQLSMDKNEVIAILGEPEDAMTSNVHLGRSAMIYVSPHGEDHGLIVTFGRHGRVISVDPITLGSAGISDE